MAKILPLNGKYYGTNILLKDGQRIDVWVTGDSPSDRELEDMCCTREQFLDPSFKDKDGDHPGSYIDWSHMETQKGYEIAKIIEKVLTENGY